MARKGNSDAINAGEAIKAFQGLTPQGKMLVACIALAGLGIGAFVWFTYREREIEPETAPPPRVVTPKYEMPDSYLFCSWNVENFFDDADDPLNHDDMEDWFGTNPSVFREKTARLADALLMMNDGRGTDILAVCEVESERCLIALRDALNARLDDAGKGDIPYQNVVFKEDKTGRRFAPGIITRLSVIGDRTQKLGSGGLRRILEGHLHLGGRDLIVIAAHWTSRVRDDTADNRMRYAESCHGRARAILTANPDADLIVCGDFNDEFKDPSLQHGLRASDDVAAVKRAATEPLLLDLTEKLEHKGTISYERKWYGFDHICVSRGLLDGKGWWCDLKKTEIFGPKELRTGADGHPSGFGNERSKGKRGFSDHLPILTRLKVDFAGGMGRPQ